MRTSRQNLRSTVAKEAALLLYSGIEEEYKQAKLRASQTLRIHLLPTNPEVGLELDRIVEKNEV